MNELIRKIALDSHLLNYVDLETPRRYFVSGNAEEEEVQLFALRCIRHAIQLIEEEIDFSNYPKWYKTIQKIEDTFRIEFSDAEKALDEMVEINQKLGLYDSHQ